MAIALVAACGCSPRLEQLTLVPALPRCPLVAPVNELQLTALGDFAAQSSLVAAATPTTRATLGLPPDTRAVALAGFGPPGLVAFGRSAPLSLDALGSELAIAYGPPDGLCATANLGHARAGHRATSLSSGAVLLSGGVDGKGAAVTALERYLPSGDEAAPAARFVDVGDAIDFGAVLGHAVARLPGGGVLISGGAASAGTLPPAAFGAAFPGATRHGADGRLDGPPRLLGHGVGRAFHSATALPDGRVLLAGGCADFDAGGCRMLLGSTTLYDPAADRFTDGPPLLYPRYGHDAVLLGDGSLLLVGGVGATAGLPAEVLDPTEARGFVAGTARGRAALLPTGAVLIAGGDVAPASSAGLWLSSAEGELALAPLGDARVGATLTPLQDGTALLAGGTTPGNSAPLYLYNGHGAMEPLSAALARRAHSATLIDDGTVLLAGGLDDGGAVSATAAVYFRSPLGPYSNLPPLTLASASEPYLPRRPDRVSVASGQLVIDAAAAAQGGRPSELVLVGGMQLNDVAVDVLAGRRGPAAAALVIAWQSDAAYAFVTLDPGQPVTLSRVASARPGQTLASPIAGCVGAVLDDSELPDGGTSAAHVSFRDGVFEVTSTRPLVRCTPNLGRGAIGLGALRGAVAFSNLTITR
jgi:hypothetical protein